MQYKLHTFLLAAAISSSSLTAHAQTVSTFDDLTLPGTDTSFLQSLPQTDGIYPFQSGNAKFYGALQYDGSYQTLFNYSNIKDTVDPTYDNTWAAITGGGAENSENYGVAYAETDLANFFQSPEYGPKLTGAAAGHAVAGLYITNTTLTYHWIKSAANTQNENYWYKFTIRGYLNKVKTADSVVVMLAKGKEPINTWEWVNLLPLGDVDSLTFQASSSNSQTPYYFAIDNLATLEGGCPGVKNIAAVSINENSATINWENIIKNFSADYEVAVDQSATLAPSTSSIEVVSDKSFQATALEPNTTYFAHIRTKCEDGGLSNWDTAAFTTLAGTNITQASKNALHVSISPNPATTQLNIHTDKMVNAIVYNIQGKELMSIQNTRTLNIASLPAGIYTLQVRDTEGKWNSNLRFTKKD